MKRMAMLVAAAATVACAGLAKQAFVQPHVTLRDVRVVGLGLTGGELEVAINVQNPNSYRMDASRFTYRVFISDSVPLANGTLDRMSTVQAGDSAVVRIPVNFSYQGLGAVGRQLMNTGIVSYKVTGDLTVATVIGNFTVPVSTTGRYSTMRR